VIEPVAPAHRGPSPERRGGNGRGQNRGTFYIKQVVHCKEQ